jgi:hypothetical protein
VCQSLSSANQRPWQRAGSTEITNEECLERSDLVASKQVSEILGENKQTKDRKETQHRRCVERWTTAVALLRLWID